MNAFDIAGRSFNFLPRLFKDLANFLILLILNAVPIINLIVVGYFARVLKQDLEEPPQLSRLNIAELFVDGVKVLLAVLLYLLIPLILAFVLIGPSVLLAYFLGLSSRVRFLSMLTIFVLVLALMLLALPQIGIVVRTGDFGKILALGDGLSLIKTFGLGNYLLLFIIIVIFDAGVMEALRVIPVLGAAIGGIFTMAFTFKALSYMVNLKYPVPPPPPAP